MIKSYRYRIYPTKRQQEVLNEQLAICCELYNAALFERTDAWRRERKTISWFDQNSQLKEIRQLRDDVATINVRALQDALRRVNLAFAGFFRRVQSGTVAGYPRFRSLRRYDSFTIGQIGQVLRQGKLRLSRIGAVRIKLHRPLGSGVPKTLTIKREAGRWFAIICVECPPERLPFNPNMIGVDVGLASFATLSDGRKVDNPRWFRAAQAKLRRLQRRVARRKRGSNRRRKAVLLLQRFHNHIRDQRRDFHHKESRKIVNANGLIAVEDLKVKGLAAGRVFVKVDPRGTSQTCTCGAEVRKTLAVRVHECSSCGLVADRDHVSAQLILAKALPSGANVDALMSCVA